MTAQGVFLYKVTYRPLGLDDPIVELARARSMREAASLVRSRLLATYDDARADFLWVHVQAMKEPEGVGIVFVPSGAEQSFVVDGGELKSALEVAAGSDNGLPGTSS